MIIMTIKSNYDEKIMMFVEDLFPTVKANEMSC